MSGRTDGGVRHQKHGAEASFCGCIMVLPVLLLEWLQRRCHASVIVGWRAVDLAIGAKTSSSPCSVAVQVACLSHFRSAPLATLTAAVATAASAPAGGDATAALRRALQGQESLLQHARQRKLFGLTASDRCTYALLREALRFWNLQSPVLGSLQGSP